MDCNHYFKIPFLWEHKIKIAHKTYTFTSGPGHISKKWWCNDSVKMSQNQMNI